MTDKNSVGEASIPTQTINTHLCSVTWGQKDSRKTLELSAGRYLIGDSAFSAIRIGNSGTNLCGALFVTPDKISVKCTGPQPVMFVEGRRLQLGETVLLGDIMELMVASTRVIIASFSARIFRFFHQNKKNRKKLIVHDY